MLGIGEVCSEHAIWITQEQISIMEEHGVNVLKRAASWTTWGVSKMTLTALYVRQYVKGKVVNVYSPRHLSCLLFLLRPGPDPGDHADLDLVHRRVDNFETPFSFGVTFRNVREHSDL